MGIKQPIKRKNKKATPKTKSASNRRQNPEKFGTSKLEADFARDFLDKIGVKYIYEYEAKDIHRFYDFAVVLYQDIPWIMENKQGVNCVKQEGQNVIPSFFIEIDGGYW